LGLEPNIFYDTQYSGLFESLKKTSFLHNKKLIGCNALKTTSKHVNALLKQVASSCL